MKLFSLLLIIGIILFQLRCSSSVETAKEDVNDDSNYVFDDVPLDDSSKTYNTESEINYDYFVQIGAFETNQAAENFVMVSKRILHEELLVELNNRTNLYIVRLNRKFDSRDEAEKMRNELWQNDKFKDAWIFKRLK